MARPMTKDVTLLTLVEIKQAIANREDWLKHNAGIERMFDRKAIRKYDRYVTEIEELQAEITRRKEQRND